MSKPVNLTSVLNYMQSRFKSKKSRYNSFGKYYFRSAEDILEDIKPFLDEHNVTVRIEEEFIDGTVPVGALGITDYRYEHQKINHKTRLLKHDFAPLLSFT